MSEKDTCGIIAPRSNQMLGFCDIPKGYLAECVLKENHEGPHVFQAPDRSWVAWEYDLECECCRSDDEGCTFYEEIGEKDIRTFHFS